VNRTLSASLLLLLTVAACAAPAPAAPAPAPAGPASGAQARTTEQRAFLDRVVTIDPDLLDDPQQVITRGTDTCADLDKPDDAAIQGTIDRFSGAGPVTADQARKILDAAKETVCAGR
jgi:hypothetical protein